MQDTQRQDGQGVDAGTALRYRVGGMDCPSCAGKVETAVGRLPGTGAVRLNFQTQILSLRLDESATPRGTLESTVRGLGFSVEDAGTVIITGKAAGGGHHHGHDHSHGHDHGSPAGEPWWRSRAGRLAVMLAGLVALGYGAAWLTPLDDSLTLLPATLLGLVVIGRRAVALARSGSPFSIETLMTVATGGALLIGESAEAAVVVLLFAIGEVLEGVAAGRARAGISALAALVPRTALRLNPTGQEAETVPAAALVVDDRVLVRPGDRVPADGVVEDGESDVDESPVTGESVPVPKAPGSEVYAGGINANGTLRLRVTRAASDNTIARILHMVEEAQAAKSPTARFIERFSARYTPAVMVLALLVIIGPPLLAGADWHTWIYRGLGLLLVGCPCALVLSTPAAITSGIAAGARRGLLVKGGVVLEAIGRVSAVAFDKTGTITEGRPHVTDIITLSGSERTLLSLAATVESGSSHPIARAITAHAGAAGVPLRPMRDASALPGRAAEAVVMGKRVAVGSPAHAVALAGPDHDGQDRIAALEADGKTVVTVVSDGAVIGLIALRDEPRPDAAAGVAALRALGVDSVMLTGDNPRTGAAIGRAVGLPVQAGLLPADKVSAITALRGDGKRVAMVGDGINDAPALAAADVGIAMDGGTDVALETADAALMRGRVTDVAGLVALSRATMANIHQNVAIALGLKALFLLGTVTGVTGLWAAILADTGATVIVTLNALRLLRWRG